jgi:hypothetical protein
MEKFKVNKILQKTDIFNNNNLLSIIFKYLSSNDILNISLVNKNFYKISKSFDYLFKDILIKKYASNYLSYSLDTKLSNNEFIYCSVLTLDENNKEKNNISPFKYSWKKFLILSKKIDASWTINKFPSKYNKQLIEIKDHLYNNLKSYECFNEDISIQKIYFILQSEFNSNFQKKLYNYYINYEENVYKFYYPKFQTKQIQLRINNLPMETFLIKFDYFYNLVKRDKSQKKLLKKLRWYCIFDDEMFYRQKNINKNINENKMMIDDEEQNDSEFEEDEEEDLLKKSYFFDINNVNNNAKKNFDFSIKDKIDDLIFNDQLINEYLSNEKNELFHIIKCISLTCSNFCEFTMNFLYTSYSDNKYSFIKEYDKRYKNYVDCAFEFNNRLENINVVINILYESFYYSYPKFPKFSIFRLMMNIWYSKITCIINEKNESILSYLKTSIISIFSNYISNDLDKILNSKINKQYHSINQNYLKSNNNLNLSLKETKDTSVLSIQNSYRIISPFGTYYEDDYIHYYILEEALNFIYDTFFNELSVYQINSINLETNNVYDEIEEEIVKIIKNKIFELFNLCKKNNKKINEKIIVESIFEYFNIYFYQKRIINKLKLKIFQTIKENLNLILMKILLEKFNFYLIKSDINTIKNISSNLKCPNDDIKIIINQLKNVLNSFQNDLTNEQKNSIIFYFYTNDSFDQKNYIDLINFVNNKFNEVEMEILKINKKVAKHLYKENLPFNLRDYYKNLLNYSVKPSWKIICKIKKIEDEEKFLENMK